MDPNNPMNQQPVGGVMPSSAAPTMSDPAAPVMPAPSMTPEPAMTPEPVAPVAPMAPVATDPMAGGVTTPMPPTPSPMGGVGTDMSGGQTPPAQPGV